MKSIKFVGLDVHAETIAVAVAEPGGEVRSVGIVPNRMESIRKLVGKLGSVQHLKVCYEAGPTGYVLYWQLTQLGVACEVVAPTLVPIRIAPNHPSHASGPIRYSASSGSKPQRPEQVRVPGGLLASSHSENRLQSSSAAPLITPSGIDQEPSQD